MQTLIFMERHSDSPKDGDERTRRLKEKGKLDAKGQEIVEIKRLWSIS